MYGTGTLQNSSLPFYYLKHVTVSGINRLIVIYFMKMKTNVVVSQFLTVVPTVSCRWTSHADKCIIYVLFNHSLKPQSNGPSYSNTLIGTLAVDG